MMSLSENMCRSELFGEELIWENPVKLYSVCLFRGIFNVNLSTALNNTNSSDRDEMIKACAA